MDGRMTVVMPISDALRYPPDPAESILPQTHQDFAFLIIDDGCTDDWLHGRIREVAKEVVGIGNPEGALS